jgi:HD-GYP domain-containing protein (c-di-GMP phosphodiesterase class II)
MKQPKVDPTPDRDHAGGDVFARLNYLTRVSKSLSSEHDIHRLLEAILDAAQNITNADGGTLYRVNDNKDLVFEIVRTDSLGVIMGGSSGIPVSIPPLPLHDAAGNPNLGMIAPYAVLRDVTVNIADAYTAQGFDFSGTRAFDERTGYRSTSFLTVPMKNHEDEIIGVLQLINARDPASNAIVPFSSEDQQFTEALASQAAIALTNRSLISQLQALFESFVGLINTAIDEKSPHTSRHCARVPELTMMLAEATHNADYGPLKNFNMTDKDRYELKLAGLLHDCGKITTPVHVIDKGTKLATIFDRIELIDTRYEILKRDLKMQAVAACAALPAASRQDIDKIEQSLQLALARLEDDRLFLHSTNIGGERMSTADQSRVRQIASYKYMDSSGEERSFLTEDEVKNLTIAKGTLTQEERATINHHIVATIEMLEALPWPKHLAKVPEYAGGHHERIDGAGYPRGLRGDQMSVQARAMAIADIFEALTAKDRPYKSAKTISESLEILSTFRLNGHIDPDLFDIFVREKVYLRFAEAFLDPEQIDAVDEEKIPGYHRN